MGTHRELQPCDERETAEFPPTKPAEARIDGDKGLREAKASEEKKSSKGGGDSTHVASYSRSS